MASDKRATFSNIVADKEAEKIIPISKKIVVAAAGLSADLQFLAKLINAELRLKELRSGIEPTAKEAANLLSNILYSKRFYFMPYYIDIFVGGYDGKDGFGLYHMDAVGSISKINKYFATGSGMTIALGVLESGYKEELDINTAKELAKEAVRAAIERDVFSGDAIDLFVITNKGIEKETIKVK